MATYRWEAYAIHCGRLSFVNQHLGQSLVMRQRVSMQDTSSSYICCSRQWPSLDTGPKLSWWTMSKRSTASPINILLLLCQAWKIMSPNIIYRYMYLYYARSTVDWAMPRQAGCVLTDLLTFFFFFFSKSSGERKKIKLTIPHLHESQHLTRNMNLKPSLLAQPNQLRAIVLK